MDTKMTKGESAMEAVALARVEWLRASANYIKSINRVLQSTGANSQKVNAVIQAIECTPFPAGDEYDENALHAEDAVLVPGSPLESKLLRLAETSVVCGGVFTEELFEQK